MIHPEQLQRLSASLPVFQNDTSTLLRDLQQAAFYARVPAGHDIFVEGSPIESIAILLSGVVRVYKIGENGREITLYRVNNGESCVLTANAILNRSFFPAIATVEQEAEAIMIPTAAFLDWMHRYEAWQRFIFGLMAQRMMRLMTLVDEIVFSRMDSRVATYLLNLGHQHNPAHITHHTIAVELGSSREVISRILEDFANRKLIRMTRGLCEIIDFKGLENRAAVM